MPLPRPTVIGLAPHPHTSPPRYPRPTRVVLPRTPRLPGRRDDPGTGSVSSLRGTVRRSTTLRSSLRFAQPPAGRMEREVMGSGRFIPVLRPFLCPPAGPSSRYATEPGPSLTPYVGRSCLSASHLPSVGASLASPLHGPGSPLAVPFPTLPHPHSLATRRSPSSRAVGHSRRLAVAGLPPYGVNRPRPSASPLHSLRSFRRVGGPCGRRMESVTRPFAALRRNRAREETRRSLSLTSVLFSCHSLRADRQGGRSRSEERSDETDRREAWKE